MPVSAYFDHGESAGHGHLDAAGNRAAFRALHDGLEGRFERP
jgi:hypothetical protein